MAFQHRHIIKGVHIDVSILQLLVTWNYNEKQEVVTNVVNPNVASLIQVSANIK